MTREAADAAAADVAAADAAAPAGELPDRLFFRIGEAAELVGVEPHVLRYWETEFGLRPQRSSKGQRLYRRRDIARFLRIQRLLHEEGFTIAGARKALGDVDPDPVDENGDDPAGLEGPEDGAAEASASVSASASAPASSGRVTQALGRMADLRTRIARVRARLRAVGPPMPAAVRAD